MDLEALRSFLSVAETGSYLAAADTLRVEARLSNDPLAESLVDVDVVFHFGEGAPRGPWLSHELWRVREWLLASRSYLERRGTPQSIDDLHRHELLGWQAPGEDAHRWPTLEGTTFAVEPALVSVILGWLHPR